jgi:hypothetical protein
MKFHLQKRLLLGVPVAGLGLLFAAGAFADSSITDFDSFNLGSVNGQDGWSATGPYDQAVVDDAGNQALRISDAVSSGSFDDWVFAKPVVDGAGEADATAGTFDVGDRQTHFEASFDISTMTPDVQPGLHLMVSPDRGDGSRMSYLLFEDSYNGIDVTFVDTPGTTSPAAFPATQIASDLDRSVPHSVKFVMDFVDGPSNDIVKIYIDDVLVHTGTSWENYYRFDTEAASEQSPRIVRTLIFQVRGYSMAANEGKGFLIDDVNVTSSVPAVTTTPPSAATIEVRKAYAGNISEECFDILVDTTSNCLGNGDSAEVGVAAGTHTIGEDAPGYNHVIFCVANRRMVGYGLYGSASTTINVNEGDHVVCTITNFRPFNNN